jgi:hypothetical protein
LRNAQPTLVPIVHGDLLEGTQRHSPVARAVQEFVIDGAVKLRLGRKIKLMPHERLAAALLGNATKTDRPPRLEAGEKCVPFEV